jgi:hypothetical protein
MKILESQRGENRTPLPYYIFDNREFHYVLTILSFQIVAFIKKNGK